MRLHRRSAAAAVLVVSTTLITTPALAAPNPNSGDKLAQAVTLDNTMRHLQAFQDIADANNGNRAAGTSGYEASAAYVEKTLRAAGYETQRQYFEFVYERIISTSLTVGGETVENVPMSYSPSTGPGGVQGALVTPTVATGCTAADWAGADATGKIALVSRGTCSFNEKSLAAGAAGATGVIIYNNADGALNGTLGGIEDGQIPTTGVTQAEGQRLLTAAANGATADFVLDKERETRSTFNVLAETRTGRADNVVMLGAHLDGVTEGPGINDNGSGSAAILEVAVQIAKANKVNNKIRFAWWGAEELGLLGSDYYVNNLVENNPAELTNIAGYLNFDMVASPNHIIGVYDANETTYPAPVPVPDGSAALETLFTNYFDGRQQPWVDTEFSGRSDYSAFIANGVPATGLFTGADGSKTADEVAKFGGTEGIPYDPNYHTPADNIGNVNKDALEINIKAIGYATGTLAYDTSFVNGKKSRGKSGKPAKVKPNEQMRGAAA